MPTTKPNRQRQPPSTTQATHWKDHHRDLDTIHQAHTYAALEKRSHGFPTDHTHETHGTGTDTVFHATQNPDLHRAEDWLNEYAETIAHLTRLANKARANWQPPTPGTMLAGVTVGTRSSTVGTCPGCGQPALGTHDDPVKRIDGNPYHLRAAPGRPACYYLAWRQRGLGGTG